VTEYLNALSAELGTVGIRGSRRRRILAEAEDHLRESGDEARFGEPKVIAARFADELATNGARRTAFFSLFALAPAGIGYALLLGLNRSGPDITSAKTPPLGVAAALVIALAPQISLAAGLLAIALAWRLRATPVAPAAAISLLHRRAAVALGAGAATLSGIAVYAVEYSRGLADWWTTLAFAVIATAIVPVAVAAVALGSTASLRAQAEGPGGDVFDDLGPLLDRLPVRLRGRPWRFCLLVAAAVAVAAFVGGGLDEGPRNAVAEFGAICACFAVLGRFLGLRG
jgi:HAAS domain-containing protein